MQFPGQVKDGTQIPERGPDVGEQRLLSRLSHWQQSQRQLGRTIASRNQSVQQIVLVYRI
jgi:hypothetical protein